ncbi:MAG: hypothetical protein U0930_22725 [Pirellulales bacterium]
MSIANSLSPDRPLLRLHQPPSIDFNRMTIRTAYEEYLVDEIRDCKPTTQADYAKYVEYWEQFEQQVIAANREPSQSSQPTQVQPESDPRMLDPCVICVLSDINSKLVAAFISYLQSELKLSASVTNKAKNCIKRIIELAGQEGCVVNPIRTKAISTKAAPKHYIDDLQLAALWAACNGQTWPIREPRRSFGGSGMPPMTFWRCVLILLRTYGMRVQDLVSYSKSKEPVKWRDITLTARTPNPDGRLSWELGWLHYTASKTGREYYLPLTRHTRNAIDRLRACAIAATGSEDLIHDRPILPCPTGHGLTNHWKALQAAARVSKPNGEHYDLEDFRKTCATYLSEHREDLPYHVCGWSLEGGSRVAHRHYINGERILVEHLPTAPMPGCFDEWLEP